MKKQLLKLSAVLSAMFIFAGIASAQHHSPIRTIEIPHVKWTGTAWETITIDGAANEESYSAEEAVTKYWTPAPPIPLPTSDLSGSIQLCYDANNIYVFCNISDDTACVYAGGASQWEYDNIEFFFDLDTAINLQSSLGSFNQTETDAATKDAAQFRANRGCDTATGDAGRNDQSMDNFAQTDAGTGWTLEIAIPFLAWMPAGNVLADLSAWVDKAMGFDVSFADSDKVPAGAGARTGQMAWDADDASAGLEDQAWHDTRAFGVMTLGTVPPATHSATAEGIVVYPNPAQSVLNISNLDNVASIEIVNMLGQVVKVVNEVDASALQLNIADLVSGNYVVRFHMDNGNTSYQNLAH